MKMCAKFGQNGPGSLGGIGCDSLTGELTKIFVCIDNKWAQKLKLDLIDRGSV